MNRKETRALTAGLPLNRREFLKTTGAGLTFAVVLGPAAFSAAKPSYQESSIGAWVTIDTDGGILILNPAAEMGQGSMTALPVILAEEMDADWNDVRIENSPIEPELYGNASFRMIMLTVGSFTVSGYFDQLRMAGAQIRRVLMDSVAREWNVPRAELHSEPSAIVHSSSNRRITYGEIAAFAESPSELPDISESDLKNPESFRLIGRSVPRRDIPAKTNGTATYAMDIHVPGMVYGMIQRSPVHDGRPASYNKAEIQSLPGVLTTVELDYGIGIVAETIHDVLKARNVLKIDWARGAQADGFNSRDSQAEYAEIPGSGRVEPRSVTHTGDVPRAMRRAAKTYSADYLSDHVYHAQMEPLNSVVSVTDSGVEVWAGSQAPYNVRTSVARVLDVPLENVVMHQCYLGGGFGRRSVSDYVVEAAHLSKAVKKPVKLIWTRPDDLQYGQFRPMNLQRMEAGVDANGTLTAWFHCIVGDGGGLLTSGARIPFYGIPNQNIELCSMSHGVRLKHWRAVGHGFNKYAIEAFLDEIAQDQGIDPLEMRRNLLKDSPRALKVVEAVAEMADWGQKPTNGRAFGMAFAERSHSLAAAVCEISVDSDGQIHVHRFWCTVDGGIIVQPENASAQIEGAIVLGLSSTLLESITLSDGSVDQSNFHDYKLIRMSQVPEINVSFISSKERPSGIGEPGVPVVGGAVANAFLALTKKPLRHMPFTPERVLEVLG